MHEVNASYDSGSMEAGDANTGVSPSDKFTECFQQVAINAETVSKTYNFKTYMFIYNKLGRFILRVSIEVLCSSYGLDYG